MEGPISDVSTPDLIDQITELAGHLNAANARWLALIAEFDRRRAWAEGGVKSCAPRMHSGSCRGSPGRWRRAG